MGIIICIIAFALLVFTPGFAVSDEISDLKIQLQQIQKKLEKLEKAQKKQIKDVKNLKKKSPLQVLYQPR